MAWAGGAGGAGMGQGNIANVVGGGGRGGAGLAGSPPGSPRRQGVSEATEAERAEWVKMFKMADADGSGNIDMQELLQLMTTLRADPNLPYTQVSQSEISRIMQSMDTDGDGEVSQQEFLVAMEAFSRMASSVTGRRNSATFDDSSSTSSKIASNVSSFFSQYEAFDPNTADRWLPKVLHRLKREDEGEGDDAEDIDTFKLTGRAPPNMTPEQKVKGLHDLAQMMTGGAPMLRQWSGYLAQHREPGTLVRMCGCFLQVLRVVEWFPTTADRVDVRHFILGIFNYCFETNLLGTLAQRCLTFDPNIDGAVSASLAINALEIVYHYIQGPGISVLPANDPWHYSFMRTKNQAQQVGLLPMLPTIASTYLQMYQRGVLTSVRVAAMAIRCIGAFASENVQTRVFVITSPLPGMNGATLLDWLLSLIVPRQSPHVLADVTWTLAVLCGETHGESAPDVTAGAGSAGGGNLYEIMRGKGLLQKLRFLLSAIQGAHSQNNIFPDCFDPQFAQIYFQDTGDLLAMQRGQQVGQQYFLNCQRFVISNLCGCFYHLIPGFLNHGELMRTQDGNQLMHQLLWFLGVAVGALKQASQIAPKGSDGSQDAARVTSLETQTNAANLRIVHMSIACLKRVIEGNSAGVPLHLPSLPAVLLAMLQMKRFTTLVAVAADMVKVIGSTSPQLQDQLVLSNGFIEQLKSYLDEPAMQTRVAHIFVALATRATDKAMHKLREARVVRALFNALQNFKQASGEDEMSKALHYQGSVFNFPLARSILQTGVTLLRKDLPSGSQQYPHTTDFGEHELTALQNMFETIRQEITSMRDISKWLQSQGTGRHELERLACEFLQAVIVRYTPLEQAGRHPQAAQIIQQATRLGTLFDALMKGKMSPEHLAQLGVGGGIGGALGGNAMMQAQVLRQQLRQNPDMLFGAGQPITIQARVKDTTNGQVSNVATVGRVGKSIPFKQLNFYMTNHPKVDFLPEQIQYMLMVSRVCVCERERERESVCSPPTCFPVFVPDSLTFLRLTQHTRRISAPARSIPRCSTASRHCVVLFAKCAIRCPPTRC